MARNTPARVTWLFALEPLRVRGAAGLPNLFYVISRAGLSSMGFVFRWRRRHILPACIACLPVGTTA